MFVSRVRERNAREKSEQRRQSSTFTYFPKFCCQQLPLAEKSPENEYFLLDSFN
jgi:hypothetical protein